VPDNVLSMAAEWQSAERRKSGPLGQQAKLVFCIGRAGELLVTLSLVVSSPLKLGVWPIDGKDLEWTAISPGQPGQAFFVANGVYAYSPNSFVLSDGAHRWISCQQSECKLIDQLSASSSYLLVDDQAGEAITLSLPNFTQPRLLVQSKPLR
jgi:hypothetical protein